LRTVSRDTPSAAATAVTVAPSALASTIRDRSASACDVLRRRGRFFGTSERFWINLQSRYDLEVERDRLGDALDGIRPLTSAS
jgi:plasmid maintenance system antidote protein VapI